MKLDKSIRAELWYVAAGLIVCELVYGAAYYLVTTYFLQKRLNLE